MRFGVVPWVIVTAATWFMGGRCGCQRKGGVVSDRSLRCGDELV